MVAAGEAGELMGTVAFALTALLDSVPTNEPLG